MAQLLFKHGTMSSGKSLELLKVAHNYEEQGKEVLVLTSGIDDRYGIGKITSRVGIDREAIPLNREDDVVEIFEDSVEKLNSNPSIRTNHISCVLVDESQFLSKKNVEGLAKIVDSYKTPVIAYGLKVDFSNNLFEGSRELLIQADKLEEIKTICNKPCCERKATMNIRLNGIGEALYEGEQVEIGGNESYVPVCRYHYYNYNYNV